MGAFWDSASQYLPVSLLGVFWERGPGSCLSWTHEAQAGRRLKRLRHMLRFCAHTRFNLKICLRECRELERVGNKSFKTENFQEDASSCCRSCLKTNDRISIAQHNHEYPCTSVIGVTSHRTHLYIHVTPFARGEQSPSRFIHLYGHAYSSAAGQPRLYTKIAAQERSTPGIY